MTQRSVSALCHLALLVPLSVAHQLSHASSVTAPALALRRCACRAGCALGLADQEGRKGGEAAVSQEAVIKTWDVELVRLVPSLVPQRRLLAALSDTMGGLRWRALTTLMGAKQGALAGRRRTRRGRLGAVALAAAVFAWPAGALAQPASPFAPSSPQARSISDLFVLLLVIAGSSSCSCRGCSCTWPRASGPGRARASPARCSATAISRSAGRRRPRLSSRS